MHNDHAQFDARNPRNRVDSGVKTKPKALLLTAAAVGGAVVGWFIPLGLIESVTTATGLSEMIPALAPPLGSTMRLALALGGGVSALALAAMLLGGSRKASEPKAARDRFGEDDHFDGRRATYAPNGRTPIGHAPDESHNQIHRRDNGDTQMARQANLRQSISERDHSAFDDESNGKSGGFFGRMKQSLSKLPLPRRFEDEGDEAGPIRDFSDLKRLRPGAEGRQDSAQSDGYRTERPVRPIAAHAELGEPLPPVPLDPVQPIGHLDTSDYGADLAELERSARLAAMREQTPTVPQAAAPVLQPQPLSQATNVPSQVVAPEPMVAAALPETSLPTSTPAPMPTTPSPEPVRYDADGINALVERLERALANVRPVPAVDTSTAPMTNNAVMDAELDLTAFAEDAQKSNERAAEEARLAALAAEEEAKRRADAIAAQEAARRAAEEADRAAEEARRRAEEAQNLLASLGVASSDVSASPAAPQPAEGQHAPLRAVVQEQAAAAVAEPEMDDALRSALRTLRRMSNP